MKIKTSKAYLLLFTLLTSLIAQPLTTNNILHAEDVKVDSGEEHSSSDGRFIDRGDGTITDTRTGLMWTKEDSYVDLGKCLDWNDSKSYVNWLNTGGYSDWRMPTVKELNTIYEKSKSNNMAHDHDSENPIHLDSIFADGTGGVWSSETAGPCCARLFSFFNGLSAISFVPAAATLVFVQCVAI